MGFMFLIWASLFAAVWQWENLWNVTVVVFQLKACEYDCCGLFQLKVWKCDCRGVFRLKACVI